MIQKKEGSCLFFHFYFKIASAVSCVVTSTFIYSPRKAPRMAETFSSDSATAIRELTFLILLE